MNFCDGDNARVKRFSSKNAWIPFENANKKGIKSL